MSHPKSALTQSTKLNKLSKSKKLGQTTFTTLTTSPHPKAQPKNTSTHIQTTSKPHPNHIQKTMPHTPKKRKKTNYSPVNSLSDKSNVEDSSSNNKKSASKTSIKKTTASHANKHANKRTGKPNQSASSLILDAQSTDAKTTEPKAVKQRCKLKATQLKRHSDAALLPSDTSSAPAPTLGFGQTRALKAIETALGIHASGYHIFAAGENGLGKRTLILRLLADFARQQPTPNDWVYVHNFQNAREPIALSMPAGKAIELKKHVESLWLTAKKRLNQRFRSDLYQSQIEAIKNHTHAKETQAYDALNEEGKQYDLALIFRPSDNKAVFVHPSQIQGSEPDSDSALSADITPDLSPNSTLNRDSNTQLDSNSNELLFDKNVYESNAKNADTPYFLEDTDLDDKNFENKNFENKNFENKDLENKDNLHDSASNVAEELRNYAQKNHMQKRLNQLTIALEQLEDEANDAIERLHRDLATRTLAPIFAPIQKAFDGLDDIQTYLQSLFDDMVQHVERIVNEDDEDYIAGSLVTTPSRYSVNIMTSHAPNSGAPVIFEDLPTHLNLLGHVEQITQLGTVTTDVSMIRTGSLHQANGGYLVLEASNLLEHPYAWQGLKRALQSKQIRLSSLEQMLTLTGSLSLAPASIGLSVKVILLGEPDLYYELLELEPEFDAVFKIRADFHDDVERTKDNEMALVAKMADMITKYQLLPFDSHALAALLDHLSLQADDQNRLSLHSDRLAQLLHESNRHALLAQDSKVSAQHVSQTITDMDERSGYLRDLYWHELKNGQQLISTQGQATGQVNALTVISYADSEFGMPARLTALIQPSLGSGDILDIERDVDLGGSLHAKGMLIMTSYLRALFSQHHALNFSASLAFEQSYAHIDGDSATLAEACALLSALADVPINQSFAITGSMNQLGEVQAVGGINAKVAGFYDACLEQGLTGQQGVILPAANITQLMLRDDIIESVAQGNFHVYGVTTLSEALTILTGLSANDTTKKGNYRKSSLFGKVLQRLESWDEEPEAEDNKTSDSANSALKNNSAPKKTTTTSKDKR